MTGGPGKPPATREFRKGQKETPPVQQPPRILLSGIHLGWTKRAPPGSTLTQWLAKDNPETNPITIKPRTVSHVTEPSSWVPLTSCSLPGCPFPIKSLALSAHVSLRSIHFWVLDKSPVSGPGRVPPSCNKPLYNGSSMGTRPRLMPRKMPGV